MDLIIILLNNVISLFMVSVEGFLVVLELTIKNASKNLRKDFNYEKYKVLKTKIEKILRLLNIIEKQLKFIQKIVNILEIVITVIKTIIGTLSNIPILPTKLIDILIKVRIFLNNVTKVLRVINNLLRFILRKIDRIQQLLNDFLEEFNEKLRRIIELFNNINNNKNNDSYNGLVINGAAINTGTNTGSIILNTNINTNVFKDNGYNFTYKQVELIILDLKDYSKIIEDLSKNPQEYKGYTFKIYELDSTIPNIKNRFAVALDNKGLEKFRSETSFTLRPSVLIESLKFKIDNHLIENYKI